jgi:hypothetical protein
VRGAVIAWGPGMPEITMSVTCAGVSGSVSTSVYAQSWIEVSGTATQFGTTGPLRKWGLQVVPMTAATTGWTIKLQGSNDDATWEDLLSLDWQQKPSGGMAWCDHRPVKRVRLRVSRVTGTLTATAYGEP